MTMPTVALIETALVEAILDADIGFRLVAANAGGIVDAIQGRVLDVPAAFVFMPSELPVPGGVAFGGKAACEAIVSVAIVTVGYTSRDAARQDADRGVYALKAALLDLVRDNDLGLEDWSGLTYAGTQLVEATETRVVYRVDFRCYVEA